MSGLLLPTYSVWVKSIIFLIRGLILAKALYGTEAAPPSTAKVQELKAQIADGSYKPDLQKVASSLLQFIVEEK